jgi:hypothetical protein
MKTRLNITVEQQLLEKVKAYALHQQVSLSSLIEAYFEKVIKTSAKRKNLLDMVDKLEPDQKVVAESYNKDNFYENQKGKYGF